MSDERAGLDAEADLLRFSTAGSVDDGKSTLIGRLLYDTKTAFEDQLQHVEDVSRRRGDERVNLALLTDGLRAEREQGITIDVAYRYFARLIYGVFSFILFAVLALFIFFDMLRVYCSWPGVSAMTKRRRGVAK